MLRSNAVRASAGPALIVVAAVLVLNGYSIRAMVNVADVRSFWFPEFCFLGRALRAGHVPAWNPSLFGGAPFAADPQSGWMYAPAMALFTALPCDWAIRWMIVLQPILAGLGLLWFLRSEGLSRVAATSGGMVLAMLIAGSELSLSLPFAATLAWTAILLAGASRYLRAATWAGRMWWCLACALAWGQLAAAHFSVGMIMGTAVVLAYLGTKLGASMRRRERSVRMAAGLSALLLASFPLVNLAFIWPRLGFIPKTNLYLGYGRLEVLAAQLAGRSPRPFHYGTTTGFDWPLRLATSPGAHVGAVLLALAFAGWWSKRLRPLVGVFTGVALTTYVLGLDAVARRVPDRIRVTRLGDLYLHNPQWFGYEFLLAMAVLVAFGLQAWREEPSIRRRLHMLGPGVLVWGILPPLLGAPARALVPLLLGAALGVPLLVGSIRRPALLALVPVLVAAEAGLGTLFWNAPANFRPAPLLVIRLSHPTVDPARDLRPGATVRALQSTGARYFVSSREEITQPLAANPGAVLDHALLFGLEQAGGYGPEQLVRYWEYVRAAQRTVIRYNRALFPDPTPSLLDLLQIGYVITPDPGGGGLGGSVVASEGPWKLYRLPAQPPRASVVTSWSVVGSPEAARRAVAAATFDPQARAVLESGSGLGPSGPSGPATPASYVQQGDQAARIEVDAPSPALVLVRNPFDAGWHATVDGRPARLLRADYLMEAVSVPAGHHVVELRYDDPRIGQGLAASALAILVLVCAAGALGVRDRRRARSERPRPPR